MQKSSLYLQNLQLSGNQKVTQIGTKNKTAIKTILMSVKKYIRTGNIVSFHLLIKNIL